MLEASDVAAINDLLDEYASRLDAGDLDGVAELFAHGEVVPAGGAPARRGPAEVRRMYDGVVLYDDGTPRTMHLVTNIRIAAGADAGEATSRCSFTVVQSVSGSVEIVLAGEYHDRFERAGDTWHFASRRIVPRLFGDLSGHYRRSPSG